ncbi:MAG: hypothetical protein RL701_8199 [Pseudomonadota bacterium]|jgi:hypothetical protein
MLRARFWHAWWVSLWLVTPYAHAQHFGPDDSLREVEEPGAHAHATGAEIIADPELGDAAPAASDSSAPSSEIISDPELSGPAGNNKSPPMSSSLDSPSGPPPSEVHLVLHARANHDLKRDDPAEEIWESTTLFSIDATLRRSESLRFGLGLTARYHFAALSGDTLDARSQRYELDVTPNAGYVDSTLSPGLHVRLGYQPVALGRFDLFSATNVLSVADLRDGPATIPGRAEVGQIGLMIDYDPVPWFSLHAVYLPFFTPHLVSVTGSDYALFPGRQGPLDAFFDGLATGDEPLLDSASAKAVRNSFKQNFLRSARDRLATSGISAFTPEPRLNHPQGALRATAHGMFGEVAATFATALERLPFMSLSQRQLDILERPELEDGTLDPNPVRIEYPRFAVIGIDGTFDVAPFSLGFELAYQFHRAQYALGSAWAPTANASSVDTYGIPVVGFTDMVQGGARIEYTQSTTWLLAVEAFASYALSLPSDPQRGWMFFESGRFMRGVAGLAGYTSDFGLTIQIGLAWLSGPSIVFVPRIGYEIITQVTLEVGAFIIDGQTPPPFASPILAIGGVYNSVDHVFAGLRIAL